MNSVKEHYDHHLGNFYSWMSGDFETKVNEELQYLRNQQIKPKASGWAMDLGAGHGIHSLTLAKLGFRVKAIDFNPQLLLELKENAASYPVEIFEDDIRNLIAYADPKPEVIICAGDTISHLDSWDDIRNFLRNCRQALDPQGQLILSFRDYSNELSGNDRFIPVKSDVNRIHTCFLEYETDKVIVTDLLHEKTDGEWKQKVSSYEKVRVTSEAIGNILKDLKMEIRNHEIRSGVINIFAEKYRLPYKEP